MHEARDWADTIVIKAGRRWGKGRFGFGDLMWAYDQVLQLHRPPDLVPPFHAWIVVPSFPQGRQPLNELLGLMDEKIIDEKKPAEWMVYLKGNDNWQNRSGLVEFKSAHDPDGLQSVGLDYLWTSESHDISQEAYEKLIPTITSPLRMAKSYHEGIPATYPEHWFERAYVEAGRNPKQAAFRKTYLDNPLLTDKQRAVIESHRETMSTLSWERMYLARYSANAGFFRHISECVAGDVIPGPIPNRTYVGGLDIGRTEDPTVLILMDAEDRKIVQHFMWDSIYSWVTIRDTIKAITEEWNLRQIVFDATALGGKIAEDDFVSMGLPVEPYDFAGTRRIDLLERLAGAMERLTVSYPPIPTLIRQLRAMQPRQRRDLRIQISVPQGEHDDYIMAFGMALTACADPHVVSIAPPLRGRSYIVTQAMADGNSGPRLKSAQAARQRRLDGVKQRALIAGIEA